MRQLCMYAQLTRCFSAVAELLVNVPQCDLDRFLNVNACCTVVKKMLVLNAQITHILVNLTKDAARNNEWLATLTAFHIFRSLWLNIQICTSSCIV